jgi:uncharacterized protein
MIGRYKVSGCVVGAALLAAAGFAGVTAIDVVLPSPAQAQLFGSEPFPFFGQRQRPRSGGGGGGFFGGFFGGHERYENPEQQAPVDNSRAPPPRKPDAKAEPVTPTTTVVVLGDAMADWLGYGLEDAFSDSPEISVVRKNKLHSGLVRYEAKGDLDWWRVARDILAQEKANYVVMMMGVSDRASIRERDVPKDADKKKARIRQKSRPPKRTRRTRNRPTNRSRLLLLSLKRSRRRRPAAQSSSVRISGRKSIPSASTKRSPR